MSKRNCSIPEEVLTTRKAWWHKKGRKEKRKKVLTKACGGGIIAKLSDERDKRAKPR